jgi:hypothetical protein
VWLTYLRVDVLAGDLTYDLAVDASGAGQPAPIAAGLDPVASTASELRALWVALALLGAFAVMGGSARRRSRRPAF